MTAATTPEGAKPEEGMHAAGDIDDATLRPFDGIYLLRDGTAGLHERIPAGDCDLTRLAVIIGRYGGGEWLAYFPYRGIRNYISPARQAMVRTFQATSAEWCAERIDVMERLVTYMRNSYGAAVDEDVYDDDIE